MFSFSLAFWLADLMNSNSIGFAIVGGIYVVIFIIYILFSKNALDNKVKDTIVKAAYAKEEELD